MRVPGTQDLSFEFRPPTYKPIAALLCAILALAIVFWVAKLISLQLPKNAWFSTCRVLFPLIVVAPLLGASKLDHHTVIRIVLGLTTAAVAFRWTETALRCAKALAIITLPLLLIQCVAAIQATAEISKLQAGTPHTPAQFQRARPRIVWLLFDELDQTLTFSDRPASVRMPQFDRLRQESFSATDAEPPGTWTIRSIPSLITGHQVVDAQHRDADLDLTFADNPSPQPWKAQSSIFQSARQSGRNTALVGWYLPYCWALGDALNYCYAAVYADATQSIRKVEYDRTLPFSKVVLNELREEGANLGFLPAVARGLLADENAFIRSQHEQAFLEIQTRALAAAADPDYGLVMIHWPIPHPPGMYHRFEHRLASDSRAHYLDNLELADETLGEVRHAMETAGVWDDSIVLITGDHGFRPFIWKNLVDWDAEDSQAGALVTRNRVPFLVKMPRQVDAITYDDHFNTILVRDLFTAMMNGEVHTASQVGSWIHTWGSAHGLDKETQNRGAHLSLH